MTGPVHLPCAAAAARVAFNAQKPTRGASVPKSRAQYHALAEICHAAAPYIADPKTRESLRYQALLFTALAAGVGINTQVSA